MGPGFSTTMLRVSVSILFVLMHPAASTFAEDKEAKNLKEALAKGDASVVLRYRYETVVDDAVGDKRAHASTLRTTLGYETLPYKGINLLLEAENVTDIGTEGLYNNAGAGDRNNGVRDRPVIADPALTEMNQAFLRARVRKTAFLLGRQEILHGDQRFVGNVGWRQHHQSFDAVTLHDQSLPSTTISYSFVDQVNRIFGDHQDMASHLLYGNIGAGRLGALKLYGYFLDYDEPNIASSTWTFGGELTGTHKLSDDFSLVYELELATQSDFADNPNRIRANYSHIKGGARVLGWTVSVARELLSGSESEGQFNTPLGTNHAFNGWADKFLRTPLLGLRDIYVRINGEAGGFRWIARYDNFRADDTRTDYGSEIDLQVTYTTFWGQTVAFKAAFYRSDGFAADTDKLWLFTQYRF